MLGEYVISSILSCSKNLKHRTSVKASAQLYLANKENTASRREGGPTQKRQVAQFWLFFLCLFFLPLSLPYVNWVSQEGCLFLLRFPLWFLYLPLFYFHGLFLFFVFQPPLFQTPFSNSDYLTFPPQEMGGPVLWEQGCQGLSGYFLLNWEGEGHQASPSCYSKASESLYCAYLRVSDIFRGWMQFYISLLNWHFMLQLIDLGRDKMGQTIDNTWSNHKQHQYGDNRDQQGHQATPNHLSPEGSPKERLQPP